MHEVETMAYVGEVPWHGLGRSIEDFMTSAEALEAAELNWTVNRKRLLVEGDSQIIPNLFANVRDRDNSVLGVVSDRYKLVQNKDAFAFTDALVGDSTAKYETAGSLDHGRRVWMLLRMPEFTVLDDKINSYLVVTNTHTGMGALKAALTPTRVVCQNTLNLALGGARRSWSVRHTGNIESKLEEAQRALHLSEIYVTAMTRRAEEWAIAKLPPTVMNNLIETVFPIDSASSPAKLARDSMNRNYFMQLLEKEDLANFKNTAWGFYNAVADFESHIPAMRDSKTYRENKFQSFIDGNARMVLAQRMLERVA